MNDLFFLHPERWPVLLAPVAILVLGVMVVKRRQLAERAFADVRAHPLLVADAGPKGRRRRLALEVGGLLMLALATLEPAFGYTVMQVERRGIDLVLCLDTSRSMNAQDLTPSRASRAKRDISTLLAELRGDRVALVAFAGDAKIICPLTHDLGAFEALLAEVDHRTTRRGGTDIGAALRSSLALLPADAEASQAIVILSDGEDLAGKALAEAERVRSRGIRLHTIGYGSPQGAKVPGDDGAGFLKDEKGQDVISRMDTQGMMQLAESCGGAFLPANAVALPLVEVFDKRIRPMEQRRFEAETRRRPRARFQWVLFPGLLLLLLAFLDRGRRRPRRESGAVLTIGGSS